MLPNPILVFNKNKFRLRQNADICRALLNIDARQISAGQATQLSRLVACSQEPGHKDPQTYQPHSDVGLAEIKSYNPTQILSILPNNGGGDPLRTF